MTPIITDTPAGDLLDERPASVTRRAADYADDTIDRARTLGTTAHTRGMVEVGEHTLAAMLQRAHVAGYSAGAAPELRAQLAAAESDAAQARAQASAVMAMVEQARARVAGAAGRTAVVELPEDVPTLPRAYGDEPGAPAKGTVYAYGESGKVALYSMAAEREIVSIGYDDARALAPLLLALVRDHDRRIAEHRAHAIATYAALSHVELCGGTSDDAAECASCQRHAALAVDTLGAVGGRS